MFVLITCECEVIGSETKVEVFATKQEAHDAMVADAWARVIDAGMPHDEFDDYVDSIEDDGGFIMDVVGWQIREIPGTLVPDDKTKTCPECGTELFDDMRVCFGCLHEFWKE
jgi:hypothetical protein